MVRLFAWLVLLTRIASPVVARSEQGDRYDSPDSPSNGRQRTEQRVSPSCLIARANAQLSSVHRFGTAQGGVRDLRHAHASWVLAGGADLQIVRERVGHAGLRATERYLHTLPDADDTALAAFARTRTGVLGCVVTRPTVK